MSRDVYEIEEIKKMNEEEQLRIMEEWFRDNYEDPAENTPYEGGYVWIWGGPYDALEELQSEFGGYIDDNLIEQIAHSLTEECPEWAPIPKESDYDYEFLESIRSNSFSFQTFKDSISNLKKLLELNLESQIEQSFYRLIYANIITSLETYLSDTFINAVLIDEKTLQRFIETNPEFTKRSLPLKDIYKVTETLPNIAKEYLLDVIWHNLAKVKSMYSDTLNISFGEHLKFIGPAIPVRHDIIHRNGKKKDGILVIISKDDVNKLLNDVERFVDDINTQFCNLDDALLDF